MTHSADIAALLSRIALGERAAFDALYSQTSAKLFGVLLRLLKDRNEAQDALQDVYVKIWQRADRYAVSDASAMSWLIAIARNHAIDRIRARKPISEDINDEKLQIPDQGQTPEAAAINQSQRRQIDHCLDQLEDAKANAVRLAYLDGFSYQELADRYEIPLNTMRTWLRRSLLKLKECLSGTIE